MTARRFWFKVADSILREELTPHQRSTFLGLLAWFNQRRARDQRDGRDARMASIPPGDLMTITLASDLEGARRRLDECAERWDLKIQERGAFTVVEWPNLSDFQGWDDPSHGRQPAATRPSKGRKSAPPSREVVEKRKREDQSSEGEREPEREDAPPSPTPSYVMLASYLGKGKGLPGTDEEKLAWCEANENLILAEAELKAPPNATKRKMEAAKQSVAIRFYTQHCKNASTGGQPWNGTTRREPRTFGQMKMDEWKESTERVLKDVLAEESRREAKREESRRLASERARRSTTPESAPGAETRPPDPEASRA